MEADPEELEVEIRLKQAGEIFRPPILRIERDKRLNYGFRSLPLDRNPVNLES